jgi:hypothetical protein
MKFQYHLVSLGISYNVDILKKFLCLTMRKTKIRSGLARFFANTYLISDRVHRISFR